MAITPYYLTTSRGQLRIWQSGEGPDLVVLPGFLRSGMDTARLVAADAPGRRVTAIELPGVGGSAGIPFSTLPEVAEAVATALDIIAPSGCPILAFDLASAVGVHMTKMTGPCGPLYSSGLSSALAWSRAGIAPTWGDLVSDGTHLLRMWDFIRDLHIFGDDPRMPALSGDPIPSPEELDRTVVSLAADPVGAASLWRLCVAALSEAPPIISLASLADIAGISDRFTEPGHAPIVTGAPADLDSIWCDYVQTRAGRVHLRRCGSGDRIMLLLPTGSGSNAQFSVVMRSLGQTHSVIAIDYLGNGRSERVTRKPSIEAFAAEAFAVLDEIGIETVDIWGSHTGSLVGLEMALTAPHRVGRLVMEAPVFLPDGFRDELLDRYSVSLEPDRWGRHLVAGWQWRRDLFLFWPWYATERKAARQLGLPSPADLHLYAMGLLESGPGYDGSFRAAFQYETRGRIGALTRPTLITAGPNDMMADGLDEARHLAPAATTIVAATPTTAWWPDPAPDLLARTLAVYAEFYSE